MEWWQVLIGVIIGLLILSIIVVIHELGHALASIRAGVIVEEFGLGFPPKVWSFVKKTDFILKKGTIISLNWLPIGGFCKLQGEADDAKKKGDYGAATLWQKTQILLAGVFMNFVTAVVIFIILAIAGMPKVIPDQFTMPGDTKIDSTPTKIIQVSTGSVAEKEGLRVDDELIKIGDIDIDSSQTLSDFTHEHAGQVVNLTYLENGVEQNKEITLGNGGDEGYLGVATGNSTTYYSTWSAPIVGFITTTQLTGTTFQGLWGLVSNLVTGIVGNITGTGDAGNLSKAGDGVSGPVGILGTLFPVALAGGAIPLLFISGVIALSLAVMNFLPIPGLDGGRFWLTIWYRVVRRKPLPEGKEATINGIGMLVLFGLIIIISIIDVIRIF